MSVTALVRILTQEENEANIVFLALAIIVLGQISLNSMASHVFNQLTSSLGSMYSTRSVKEQEGAHGNLLPCLKR